MKKVLITLGCSMTEGVGCYVPEYLNDKGQPINDSWEYHHRSFHKNGWPNKVGKKMGFDHVINTGYGGSGNTYAYASFIDWINPSDLKDCDVTVIWLLTEPSRTDVYYEKQMTTVSSNNPYSLWQETYCKAIFTSSSFDIDHALKTRLCIRSLKDVCKGRGWKSCIISYLNPDKVIGLKKEIDVHYEGLIDTKYPTAYCGHPTEEGYNVISDRIVKILKRNGFNQGEYNNNITWVHLHPYENIEYQDIKI